MILTHELAHLRRRDHWVRVIEFVISTVYWLEPVGLDRAPPDAPGRGTMLRRLGPLGISRVREALRRSGAVGGRFIEHSDDHAAGLGQFVSASSFR